MTITAAQLRAARGMLDWTRAELAKAAEVSPETIKNIEHGTFRPQETTINALAKAFGNFGIEFTEGEGVRRQQGHVDIFEGSKAFEEFYDFLYEHLKKHGGHVCLSIYDETLPTKYRKNPEIHRKRMKELIDRGDVTFRILATISDFVSHGYVQFRWQPQQLATPTGFYAFGDCLALMSFVGPHAPYIVVIRSAPLAEGYRQSFEVAWNHAEKQPSIQGKKTL